jgi:hypothetical protein
MAAQGRGLYLRVGALVLAALARGGAETSDGTSLGLVSLARAAVEHGESTYWVAMAVLGLGSVGFCRALLTSALLPRALAVWGIIGYAIFAAGSALQLVGYPVGLLLSAPGGLFEVAAGSYLLVKGFREPTLLDADRRNGRAQVTPLPVGAAVSNARV